MSYSLKDQNRAAGRACVAPSVTSICSLSTAPVFKGNNVFLDLISDVTYKLAANSDTTLLEDTLPKYCRDFHHPSQELPDHRKQGNCDVKSE